MLRAEVISKDTIRETETSKLMKQANKYESTIWISREGRLPVRCDNFTLILLLQICKGDNVTISADGPDEKRAVQTISELLKGEG